MICNAVSQDLATSDFSAELAGAIEHSQCGRGIYDLLGVIIRDSVPFRTPIT